MYRPVSEHSGWPVLRNGDGMYCYYRIVPEGWYLHKYRNLERTSCRSHISAVLDLNSRDGMLPLGIRRWSGPMGSDYGLDKRDHFLNFLVLVRSSYVCIIALE
eukprot:COSAG02_NODE_3175_length_7227_cov_4.752104_4_plen_103_part_00